MSIERLQFERGHAIDQAYNVESTAMAMSIVNNNREHVQILSTGEYDLTPPWWHNPTYSYKLIVNEDGTGTYISTPQNPVSGIRGVIQDRREIRLPQDASWIMVLGPNYDGHSLVAVYDIVLYSQGISPES